MKAVTSVFVAVLITSSLSIRNEDSHSFEATNDNRENGDLHWPTQQQTQSRGSGATSPDWDESSGAVLTELGSNGNVSEDKRTGAAAMEELRNTQKHEGFVADTYSIPQLLEACKAGALPQKYFVSSSELARYATFTGMMMRFGNGPGDWQLVMKLQNLNLNGKFHDPVKLTFEKKRGSMFQKYKVFLTVYDGRHRFCAVQHQNVQIHVTVGCSGITTETLSDAQAPTGGLLSAKEDCKRAQKLYIDWKDEDDKRAYEPNYGLGGLGGMGGIGGGMGFPFG